ncbi:hypothetical protein JJB79_13860 [Pantoea eucrina]|uniref:Uncharacterized protein n=1 Tax=Pantoea eucrina TaxID=472693 RepID=A0ABS1Z846_9GAMM|nr:hypothetical protein [Pantoea eucrina]MBM0748483.1 hypothetical protein [Pantoea eucrina]
MTPETVVYKNALFHELAQIQVIFSGFFSQSVNLSYALPIYLPATLAQTGVFAPVSQVCCGQECAAVNSSQGAVNEPS